MCVWCTEFCSVLSVAESTWLCECNIVKTDATEMKDLMIHISRLNIGCPIKFRFQINNAFLKLYMLHAFTFWGRVSLCKPEWLQTYRYLLASVSGVLGLTRFTTMPGSHAYFLKLVPDLELLICLSLQMSRRGTGKLKWEDKPQLGGATLLHQHHTQDVVTHIWITLGILTWWPHILHPLEALNLETLHG